MLLEYLDISALIKVTSDEITNFIANLANYTSIQLTSTLTCGTDIVLELTTDEVQDTTQNFYIVVADNALYIKPISFGITSFIDGIYKVEVRFNPISGGYTAITSCRFIDINYKCQVASLLNGIVAENQTTGNVQAKTSSIAHLLHYSLVNGSNCGCNCDGMCTNFNALTVLLTVSNTQASDCGC